MSASYTPAVLLTEREVARVLRVTPRTVRRWAAVGTLTVIQIGGVRRFRVDQIVSLLDPSTSEAPVAAGSALVEPLNDEDRACRRGLAPTSAGVGDGHVLPRE